MQILQLACTALTLVCVTSTAEASRLDIDNLIPTTSWSESNSPFFSIGQTFTTSETGSLDEVVLRLSVVAGSHPRTASLEIYKFNDRVFNKIGDSSLSVDSGFNFKEFHFGFANLNLIAGEPYAFLLISKDVRVGTTGLNLPNTEALHLQLDGLFEGRAEIVFATYITPIPEPSTILLALISIATIKRRRRVPLACRQ